ncbi:MAG TPA: head GIN domain-containing protein [Burkholderiaceae bacterium]|nr:head GIN domain-containing protein [Burkholderiaceae bacterium]
MPPTRPIPAPARSVAPALLQGVVWLLALSLLAVAPVSHAETVVGNGTAASETRTPGAFNAIGLQGGLALEVRQGSPASVVVHADSNLVPLIESVVEGDHALRLRWKPGTSVRTTSRAWVEVTAPQIGALSSAGSGDITIDGMKMPRLAVSIQGSGALRAKALDVDDLSLATSGSAELKLAGRAARVNVDLSGSGGIETSALHADDVRVGIAGSGNANVHAARTLAVSIAGSGDVTYSGDPSVQRAIAGSGQVRKR